MNRKLLATIAGLPAMLLSTGGAAAAVTPTLDPYQAFATYSLSAIPAGATPSISDVGGVTGQGCLADAPRLCASANVSVGYPVPGDGLLSLSLTSTGGQTAQGASASSVGDATLTFWAEVVGASSVAVPIGFSATSTLAVTGSGLVEGQAALNNVLPGPGVVDGGLSFNDGLSGGLLTTPLTVPASFAGTQHASVMANTPFSVQLTLLGIAGTVNPVGGGTYHTARGTVSGTVDPMVTIDPSFLLPGYYVVFSASPVPEPSPLVLMAAGLGVAGAWAARQRKAS